VIVMIVVIVRRPTGRHGGRREVDAGRSARCDSDHGRGRLDARSAVVGAALRIRPAACRPVGRRTITTIMDDHDDPEKRRWPRRCTDLAGDVDGGDTEEV